MGEATFCWLFLFLVIIEINLFCFGDYFFFLLLFEISSLDFFLQMANSMSVLIKYRGILFEKTFLIG